MEELTRANQINLELPIEAKILIGRKNIIDPRSIVPVQMTNYLCVGFYV